MATAIVTGAARGIGAAVAARLADQGHDLVLVDRVGPHPDLDYPLATPQDLAVVIDRCGGVAVVGDVADADTSARAVDAALDHFGRVDIAVAAAGIIAGAGPVWRVDDRAWRAGLGTNVDGVHNLARAVVPAMLAHPDRRAIGGRFVAIGSAAALRSTPRLAAYATTKAAVIGYVTSLAADLADTGVTANVVAPGSTATALLDYSATVYDLDDPAEFATHHQHDRLLDPSEVAATVGFLASPSASGITGAVIPVDLGMV